MKHGTFELPHTKILILAAVCISVIAISIAYKISEAQKINKAKNIYATAGSDIENNIADKRIASALYEAQLASLGTLASSSDPLAPSPKDTLTDRFSKDIFSAYIEYERSGQQLTDEQLSKNPIGNINTDILPKPKYILYDMPIFTPKTKDEIKEYGNLFAKTYTESLAPIAAHPEQFNDDLINIGVIYKKTGEALIKLKVPSSLAEKQLNIANAFIMMSEAFPLVNGQQKDPVKALMGLKVVRESMENQIQMFTSMSAYFKQNDILFEKGEPGALWNNIATTTNSLN